MESIVKKIEKTIEELKNNDETKKEIEINKEKIQVRKIEFSADNIISLLSKDALPRTEKILLLGLRHFFEKYYTDVIKKLEKDIKTKEIKEKAKKIEEMLKEIDEKSKELKKEVRNEYKEEIKDKEKEYELRPLLILYEDKGEIKEIPYDKSEKGLEKFINFMCNIYNRVFNGEKINFYVAEKIIKADPKYKVAPAGASGDYKTPSKASTSSTQEKKESESPKQESGKEVGKSTKEKRKYTWDLKNIGNYEMSKEALCYVGITSLSHVAYASMLFPYVALGVVAGAAVGAYVAYKVGRKAYNAAKKVVKGFISWIRGKKKSNKK